ncbi:DUF1573 domain-containing protein [Bacteroides sp. ET71]|uniref:DUF1573 domain-containing protein n=1 Tax=Bacteroides sp. ET71 TaxID=2939421 RepID=UPI002011896B|nr:DUF1573 domain-containing protein [Bacteroides sp. ET71]MCL1616074.1 DUF1573 domain-containing protein [Bacteroides sp. ET71]
MRAILYVLCFFLSIVSCSQSEQKEQVITLLQEWQGKRIVIPDSMYTIQGNRYFVDTALYRYRILNYVDSVGCLSCNLKLQEWNMLSKEFQDKNCQVTPLFVFYPGNVAKIREIRTLAKNNKTDFPIIIDTLNVINRLNKFPEDTRFHTYLLDKDNKVLAIGNPVLNPAVKELYLKIIQGKTLQDDSEGKKVVTSVSLEATALSMGDFSWQEERQGTFRLKNTGEKPLVIQDIVTSCGCLTVDYSQEPVMPGKEAVLRVTYKADSPGYFNKVVTVYCNAENSPIRLRVSGNALEKG